MAYVMDHLLGRGVTFTVIPHPKTPTASGEAHALHIPEGLVAKTVVIVANDAAALMVIPASRKLDMVLAAEAAGAPAARLATERELQERFPDFELGALPPLSTLLSAPAYADPAVVEREEIVFAAGRQDVSIRMSTKALLAAEPVVVVPLTIESVAASVS